MVGSPSKTTDDLFASVWSLIKRYNGYGHIVEFLYVDAEQSLVALADRLQSVGILLIPASPEQHQQRIERHTQTLNNRLTCLFSR